MTRRRHLFVVSLFIATLFTQGCAVVAVGTAGAVAAKSANDRRTVGTQIDDTTASTQIAYRWGQVEGLSELTNLQVNVYNGVALLTGQAPSQPLINQAESIAKSVEHITKVHNQIRIGQPISASTQANDIWLGSKVKTQLLTEKDVPSLQINVVVEDSEVFLMGRLTNAEATKAVEITRNVNGVKRVVRALELM
ncbi:BON domain-containing protein [Alteromonas sediminis]|uniref:BON domain-containing protein n=1 Tax=Alteromonas sediminis TaxID=2259342 RepID=A0A3N5YE41_9ALTE|nr:BON domain-containing protein [Alteromonas sediminis]RPJ67885.1 BON domain-containing protein [Alteromonas sediminis]